MFRNGRHDCGKVTTPEWVMDKATKLSAITDRIDLIATRFACAKAQAEIACLRAMASGGDERATTAVRDDAVRQLDEDLAFLRRANTGGEFMKPEDQQRVRDIARRTWTAPDGTTVTDRTLAGRPADAGAARHRADQRLLPVAGPGQPAESARQRLQGPPARDGQGTSVPDPMSGLGGAGMVAVPSGWGARCGSA